MARIDINRTKIFFLIMMLSPVTGHADNYVFDASMLNGGGGSVDVSVFNAGGQLPGTYPVDIILDGKK